MPRVNTIRKPYFKIVAAKALEDALNNAPKAEWSDKLAQKIYDNLRLQFSAIPFAYAGYIS